MQSPTRLNAHAKAKLPRVHLGAITLQLEELKQVGPEWDGPGTITPEPDVVDLTAAWLSNCSRLRGRVGLQSKFRAWLSLCERPDGP